MSFADAQKAIEARFQTAWAGQTAVKYEGQPFIAPRNSHWVALHVLEGEGGQRSLNSPFLFLYPGQIVVQIFAPQEAGTQTSLGYADEVDEIFRRAEFAAGDALITCEA